MYEIILVQLNTSYVLFNIFKCKYPWNLFIESYNNLKLVAMEKSMILATMLLNATFIHNERSLFRIKSSFISLIHTFS